MSTANVASATRRANHRFHIRSTCQPVLADPAHRFGAVLLATSSVNRENPRSSGVFRISGCRPRRNGMYRRLIDIDWLAQAADLHSLIFLIGAQHFKPANSTQFRKRDTSPPPGLSETMNDLRLTIFHGPALHHFHRASSRLGIDLFLQITLPIVFDIGKGQSACSYFDGWLAVIWPFGRSSISEIPSAEATARLACCAQTTASPVAPRRQQ